MISAAAVTLALAFWAPYNNSQPVCPGGVQIVYDHPTWSTGTGLTEPQDMEAHDCRFHVRADVADQLIPYQCMIVAHELGHAAMGLPDSAESGNIMAGPTTIPGACYPASAPHKGHGRGTMTVHHRSVRLLHIAARRAATALASGR